MILIGSIRIGVIGKDDEMAEGIRGEVRKQIEMVKLLNNVMEKRNEFNDGCLGINDEQARSTASQKAGILHIPVGLAQGTDAKKRKQALEGHEGLQEKHRGRRTRFLS